MMKKTRLSFSSLSIDPSQSGRERDPARRGTVVGDKKPPAPGQDRKRGTKSSTYQYSKKRFGQSARSRPFGAKNQSSPNGMKNVRIPPPEKGVIRIIPLGGVEEIGKNMTAIEIGEDIIVVDAGMHFSNEATPGVDYVIPNTTYLEERKDKI